MKDIKFVLIVVSLVVAVLSLNGIDIANPTSISTFSCLKNNGNSFAIVRAFRSGGSLDANAVTNLRNAMTVGFTTDIYMFPCRGKDPVDQVNTMMSAISSTYF